MQQSVSREFRIGKLRRREYTKTFWTIWRCMQVSRVFIIQTPK